MTIKKSVFESYIKQFQFHTLFNELGWEHVVKSVPLAVNDEIVQLDAAAEKRGFLVFVCQPLRNGKIPPSTDRKKIEHALTKLFFEHLLIFVDRDHTEQLWQLSIREPNKPVVMRETRYYAHQSPELLFQRLKGLFFTVDEEENIGLVDVKQRVSDSFNTNAEKVTKRFYDQFKKEHTAFLKFIEGIEQAIDQDWYASLMLNRLMFIYFIQRKGFLDNNRNYLRDKLKESRTNNGKDQFYSFYRSFLLVLFHEGLGAPERNPDILKTIGRVPYLNGGLFDVHRIEATYPEINIADAAFERIFTFFDQWEWHLDTRITASGREVNPDVIGYIFEKYINDRAAMGAYYTKEDITEYISKNTILPFLFGEAKNACANAFRDESSVWRMLQENPDRYIYEAVQHGVTLELPDNIAKGIASVAERGNWNTPAPSDYALPTEIWREVVARRQRYAEVQGKIERGEIRDINDFITYNLNIRQFAQDVVEQYEGSDLIHAFYTALTRLSILDPTCGSGAFLFAAMNILEPLYEACLERMEDFVEDDDRKGGQKFQTFRAVLCDLAQHPNREYYIYKSIILNNLHGVDIMNEAVEIAKLRLFLKLVATVDVDYKKPNLGLEPLPDIDFNIRAGNTLVGFATKAELEEAFHFGAFDFDDTKGKVQRQIEAVAAEFQQFKTLQLASNTQDASFKEAKRSLNLHLHTLNEQLHYYLAKQYGKDPENPAEYAAWKQSHQPFHWFAEFYEIIHEHGGFDVIIGNPPYVEYKKLKNNYQIKNFETERCGNLYAFIMERSTKLLKENGHISFIIPLASFSTKRMQTLQDLYQNNSKYLYLSHFEATSNPTTLFMGVKIQLTIVIWNKNKDKTGLIFTTNYLRSYANERFYLCSKIKYVKSICVDSFPPRVYQEIEISILNKFFKSQKNLSMALIGEERLFYRNMGNFFFKLAFNYEPPYFRNGQQLPSSTVSTIKTNNKSNKLFIISLINSTLFYYYWILFSDCYHLSKVDIANFPLDLNHVKESLKEEMANLCEKYIKELENLALWQIENTKNGEEKKYRRYFPQKCKPISDEIDRVLAQHYGFTDEELDFILNYDIKYRMGKELEGEAGEDEGD